MTPHLRACAFVAAAALPLMASAENPTPDWTGLWTAERVFGPHIQGTLLLRDRGGSLIADIAGFEIPVKVDGVTYAFTLPDEKGSFRGRLVGREIDGLWVQEK